MSGGKRLPSEPGVVRNVCILAHVDHGKTSLADQLVSSNGLISARSAGQIRYMDSRQDEQQRGITMKTSSIALVSPDRHVVHLIDSPGHVDFTGEVVTAVRICDGCLLVVDVVEGVQPQTKIVLATALANHLVPILVVNKMDRLIVERRLSCSEAYLHLKRLMEQVNALVAECHVLKDAFNEEILQKSDEEHDVWDESERPDSYFEPEKGNVIFASATHNWAFDLTTFADIFGPKLNIEKEVLKNALWGDFYAKGGNIVNGALLKGKPSLFEQMVLSNVWNVYSALDAGSESKERLAKMASSLNVELSARELKSEDSLSLVKSILAQWIGAAKCIMRVICEQVPSPQQLSSERIERLMGSSMRRFESMNEKTKALKSDFLACDRESNKLIVLVAKMMPIDTKLLNVQQRREALSEQERRARREKLLQARNEASKAENEERKDDKEAITNINEHLSDSPSVVSESVSESSTSLLAFARVFSGTLTPGQEVYVLGPKHDPDQVDFEQISIDDSWCLRNNPRNSSVFKAKIGRLFLLSGRDVQEVHSVSAGHVVGIAGLSDFVLKSAVLSTELCCPPFTDLSASAVPILRVAVEPVLSSDLGKLAAGLRLLDQADPHVQLEMTDKGEHVLVTCGEVHLERCIRDLQESYAGIEVNVSAPIVPFRETIVPPPKVDRVNEALGDENRLVVTKKTEENIENSENESDNFLVEASTSDKSVIIRLRAHPLPKETTEFLEKNELTLKLLMHQKSIGEQKVREFRSELRATLDNDDFLSNSMDQIWSFGPRRTGPNLLLNRIDAYKGRSVWSSKEDSIESSPLRILDSYIVNGFQLATLSGPLCEEPMMGVAITVESIEIKDNKASKMALGQLVTVMKETCRKAFQAHPQRLMVAMYACSIQVKVEALGKLFASLNMRHGRVVNEEMIENSSTFNVQAFIPVIESLQFAQEIRRQTSGLALPQLIFSHFEVVDLDPFWEPETEEELMHFGEKADAENQARRYMNDVRKRKGLKIDEKIVEFAEKQRTLTRMK